MMGLPFDWELHYDGLPSWIKLLEHGHGLKYSRNWRSTGLTTVGRRWDAQSGEEVGK